MHNANETILEVDLNKLEHKNSKSFFILKRNKDQSGLNHVILDHFGSKKLYSLHLSHLINSQKNLKGLEDYLNSLNLKFKLDFLYSVYEDKEINSHMIFYHGKS